MANRGTNLLLAGALAANLASCTMKSDPMLSVPREGRPVEGRVAVVYSERYGISLGGLERMHPFDIRKYDRIFRALEEVGVIAVEDVYVPAPLSEAQIRSVHTDEFVAGLERTAVVASWLEAPELRLLPRAVMKRGVLDPLRTGAGGTIVAAECALELGIGINLAGGYHHAKPHAGEGFCVFADIPIAIRELRRVGKIGRVLVIDLDVHQGNGTVVCLRDDPQSYTFSIHQGDIYPVPKEWGDRDVEIAAGTTDREYLGLLRKELPRVLDASRPDLVFLVAGCDTLAGDPLASCAMTPQGVAERDAWTVRACRERGVPVVVTLGGGYSKDAWQAQFLAVKRIVEEAVD